MTELEENKVVNYLMTKTEPTPTLELAREVFGKGSSTKLINPILYKLEREQRIIKSAQPDGSKPHWSLKL